MVQTPTAQSPTIQPSYLADFRSLESTLAANGSQWFHPVREHALSRFLSLGFPTARRGNERWKYTSVSPIAEASFHYPIATSANGIHATDLQQALPWSDSWINLVFVNGHFSHLLSSAPMGSEGLEVATLAEAMKTHKDEIQKHLAHYARFENEPFTALNTAFLRDGAFIRVADGTTTKRTVHLIFVATDLDQPSVSYPRALVIAGKGSQLTLIESYVGLPKARSFTNSVTELVVGEGAQVDHYRLLRERPESLHVGTTWVYQERDSSFSSAFFALGGTALARNNIHVLLDGQGSSSLLKGLYVTRDRQHIDNFINIDHAKPHTSSRLYYKGILDGRAEAVFGGTVMVRKNAQKVDAKQSDKNLLLSNESEVNSKPALLIYNDDVKCGHGATAGHMDENSLFYLRSRGLDLKTAVTFLIHGFANEVIEAAQPEPLREYLDRWILGAIATEGLGDDFPLARALPTEAPRFQYGGKP